MERVVTHPRLICGLLSELDAERALLIARCQHDTSTPIYETLLEFQSGPTFKESTFTLPAIVSDAKSFRCEAVLEGWRISFECSPINKESSIFELPKNVTLTDFRGDKRISFPYGEFPAEIRYPGGILLGFANDISRDYISILVDVDDVQIDEDLECEILVRNVLGNIDVYHRRLKIFNTICIAEGRKLVFRSIRPVENRLVDKRNAPRREISSHKFRFKSEPIGQDPYFGTLEINNVSLTGFSTNHPDISLERRLLKGLLLHGDTANISFYLVRNDPDSFGFKIHPASAAAWTKFLETLVVSEVVNSVGSSELSKLLTSSSYIRRSRRQTYGKSISPHIAHSGDTNQTLCRRMAYADSMGEISDHVSAFRFSDHVWMIQEGASGLFSDGSTIKLIQNLVGKLIESYPHEHFRARFLLAQFSAKIPTIKEFWHQYARQECNQIIKGYHLGNQRYLATKSSGKFDITDTNDWSVDFHRDFSHEFDSLLLNLFDFWNPSKKNIVTNGALSSFGEGHAAYLFGLSTGTGSKALLYRNHTYYSSNSSGMITGIYIVFSKTTANSDIREIVQAVCQNSLLMKGTSDIVIFDSDRSHSRNYNDLFESCDEFDCIVIDQKRSTA